MAGITDTFQRAAQLQQAGDLRQAEQVCRQVLESDPRHAEALHLLGLIAYQSGQYAQAAEHVGAALRLEPRQAVFHATMAAVYHGLGKLAEAVGSYRQAIALRPDYAEAHNNLGVLLQAQGDVVGSRDAYREAIRLQPQYADAHHNLGIALQLLKDFTSAMEEFTLASRLDPGLFEARLGMGHVLHAQGKLAEATAHFESCAHDSPDSHLALCGLGYIYQCQRRYDDAITQYRRAIQLFPQCFEAHYNMGIALRDTGRVREAIPCLEQAMRTNPSSVEAHVNLSGAFQLAVLPDEASAAARRAVELSPWSSLAWSHLAVSQQMQGDLTAAIASFRRTVECNPDDAANHGNLIYMLNFHEAYDAPTVLAEHRAWARRHADPLTAVAAPHDNDRNPARRLRIGYLSSHFRDHAVSFFVEPMLAAHDHGPLEIYCYADVAEQDTVTERIRRSADRWQDVAGLSDLQVADLVRRDQIDILVDLAGHIGGNHLGVFARKPAPIQVTYLGYQTTTGMTAMDYRLTDEHADPPGLTDAYHIERLVRLPRSFFCYLPPEPAPPVSELPALVNGYVTFASLNQAIKMRPETLAIWAQILAAVPRSRLLVLAYTPGQFERHVRDIMGRAGVGADRVEVVNKRSRYQYLELLQRSDVALDTFPFNGHTTVCDALWMGVPSIMLEGSSYASRFGGSTLLNVGLGDLIARTQQQYIDLAVELAGDLPRLAEMRRTMRARFLASPLADAVGFTRHVEQAYRTMWREWCQ